jgi:hypothetical protein
MRRVTRWRSTEFPTAELATMPTRRSRAPCSTCRCTTKPRPEVRLPRLTVAWKSLALRIRRAEGSISRLRAGRGPWHGGSPESRGPHGCASGAGSRGSSPYGGCSAGRCASWGNSWEDNGNRHRLRRLRDAGQTEPLHIPRPTAGLVTTPVRWLWSAVHTPVDTASACG